MSIVSLLSIISMPLAPDIKKEMRLYLSFNASVYQYAHSGFFLDTKEVPFSKNPPRRKIKLK